MIFVHNFNYNPKNLRKLHIPHRYFHKITLLNHLFYVIINIENMKFKELIV